MKHIDFTQAGGFPLELKTLATMQNAYFQILQMVVGHFDLPNTGSFIISGCEVTSGAITSGMLYIDGTLCPFATTTTGDATTKIAKIETIEDAPFENGNNLPVYFDYEAVVNSNGVALSQFVRLPKVAELVNVLPSWNSLQGIPSGLVIDPNYSSIATRLAELEKKAAVFQQGGGMVLWNKPANQIPTGWAEVVNWRGRMPIGMDATLVGGQLANPEFSTLGAFGGQKERAVNMPVDGYNVNSETNGPPAGRMIVSTGQNEDGEYLESIGKASTTQPIQTTINIMNPYRVVLFIEYIN